MSGRVGPVVAEVIVLGSSTSSNPSLSSEGLIYRLALVSSVGRSNMSDEHLFCADLPCDRPLQEIRLQEALLSPSYSLFAAKSASWRAF